MNTARLKEDGALQLPPEIAGRLNIKPGDTLSVEIDKAGVIRLYPKTSRIEDVCGMLVPHSDTHVSVEQMDATMSDAFRRGEL